MEIVCKKAMLTVKPVRSRKEVGPDGLGKLMFHQLTVVDRGNTLAINDGGWDLSKVPDWEPCDIRLNVTVQQEGFAYKFSLNRDVPPEIVPSSPGGGNGKGSSS